jgi:HD superfamily phosphohydrolase
MSGAQPVYLNLGRWEHRMSTPIHQIGPWNVLELLGRGDFASVYKVRSGTEEFALKLCTAESSGAITRIRLEQEALQQLNHINIPHLIDAGIYQERPYIVMTMGKGRTIKAGIDHLAELGALHGDIATMRILSKLLSAVSHVHDRGLVHRDIKDENILAELSGESVTLIDFGFCKAAGNYKMRTPDSFWRVGAARYSPPSKLDEPSLAMPAHDVFAIGIIGYQMLTGNYPWSAPSDRAWPALRALQLNTAPSPIAEQNSHTAAAVSAFISRLIQINDEDRPTAPEAFDEAVNFLEDAKSAQYRIARGKRRNPYSNVTRDPIYGDIWLTDFEKTVLDTQEMQRLRSVRQLGLTNRVYDSAEHSRFSHSVGCVARVEQILRTIEDQDGIRIDDELRLPARLFALTHDVTHIPFGHTLEDEFNFFEPHDRNRRRIERIVFGPNSGIGRALNSNEIGRAVLRLLDPDQNARPPGAVADLVSGVTGADVLDYIDRDAYFCGLDHKIDSAIFRQFRLQYMPRDGDRRLISLVGGKYGVRVDREFAIESILEARYAMFLKVYADPTKIAASALLAKGLTEAIYPASGGRGQIREEHLEELGVGDDVVLERMRQSKKDIVSWASQQILQRHLPRSVYRAELLGPAHREARHYEDLQNELKGKGLFDPRQRAVIEMEIARAAKLEARQVMVYCPHKAPGYQRVDLWVANASDESPARQPPSAGSEIKSRHLGLWELWVFVANVNDEQRRNAVADVAQQRFGFPNRISIDRRQGRLF